MTETVNTAVADTAPAHEATPVTSPEPLSGPTLLTGEAPADQGTAAAEAKPTDAPVPHEYQDFTLPEGMSLDTELAASLKTVAKDCRLTQDQAQQFATLGGQLAQKWMTRLQESHQAQQSEWVDQSQHDTEYGGAHFQEHLSTAVRALDQFGSPALKQFLNESGLGNHPELIRLLYRAGQAIRPDTPVIGEGNPEIQRPHGRNAFAQQLYPNQT